MASVTFYFDLGSPFAYLTAERLAGGFLPEPIAWQPVLLGGLFAATGRSSWSVGDCARRRSGIAEIERRARSYGLEPLRWPEDWPANTLTAMRAATYALSAGRVREFALAAFRAAFALGRDLTDPQHIWEAGEASGLARAQLEAATQDPAVKQALREATDGAHDRGVIGVPTVAIDDELFWGDDRLADAAARLSVPSAQKRA